MFQTLDMFKTAMSMARHAGLRQALASQNVANADTPGYRALAVPDFGASIEAGRDDAMRATRAGHLSGARSQTTLTAYRLAASEPNDNGVSLEQQILASVDAKRQHDRALAIYRSTLGLLRSSLSKQ